MATALGPKAIDWREEWFEFEDAIYLNLSERAPLPKVALRAAQATLEMQKFPHRIPHTIYFELPNRIRTSIAKLIGGKAEEITLTTGASSGMVAAAYAIAWKPGDEILTAKGEFPAQFATWKPLEAREGVRLRVISPRERWITADDFLAAMTPRTKLVSASLVRFDDGSLLDAARVAAACRAQGTYFLLDASQCCGAIPLDVRRLGADFLVSAGYKWLLGPYGTAFLWVRGEIIETLRPGPFYWMALDGADRFQSLIFDDPKPAPGARRWDSAETASFFNLSAFEASLELVHRAGPETVAAHNRELIAMLYDRLPRDRCLPASPSDPARRGPYACFSARTPEKTAALQERLRKENIFVSLREGNLRVAPYLYNTERDMDRLIAVITA